MAPELVSDPERVSEKADVWSLGMVLWEMLTRQVPFTHLTPQQIIAGLMVGNLQPEVCLFLPFSALSLAVYHFTVFSRNRLVDDQGVVMVGVCSSQVCVAWVTSSAVCVFVCCLFIAVVAQS